MPLPAPYELSTISGSDLASVRRSLARSLGFYSFPNLAALAAADIPADIMEVTVQGARTPGDAGPSMVLRRVDSQPSFPGWVRSIDRYKHDGVTSSTDGGYWVYSSNNQPLYIEWFGGAADFYLEDTVSINPTPTDNLVALQNASKFIKSTAGQASGPTVQLGYGAYYKSDILVLDRSVCLRGMGHGYYHDNASTWLVTAAGKSGIHLPSAASGHASASNIRDIYICSLGYGGQTDKHGIIMEAPSRMEGCSVVGFGGDGIRIVADVGGGSNANVWYIGLCAIYNNAANGVFTSGGDANAGTGHALNFIANGGWAVRDDAFLGNTWIGCHASGNVVGAYRAQGVNAPSVLVGCYSESDQPASYAGPYTTFVGGIHAAGITLAGGMYIRGTGHLGGVSVPTGTIDVSMGGSSDTAFEYSVTGVGGPFAWRYFGDYWGLQWANYRTAHGVLGDNNNFRGGRLAPNTGQAGTLCMFDGFYLGGGDGGSTADNTRKIGLSNAAPTEGSFAAGEFRFKRDGTGARVCTADGFMGLTWTNGEYCFAPIYRKASNGHWYRMTNANGSSTVEPTHTTGTVTGADGLAWEHLGTANAVWRELNWSFLP